MEKTAIFGMISLLSFIAILFTPTDSNAWQWLLLLGIFFGAIWWAKKK